jgi:hypothetical protein
MVWDSAELIKQVKIYNSTNSSYSDKIKALELINLNNFKISQNLTSSGQNLNINNYDRASIKVIPQVANAQLANQKISKKEYDKKIEEFKKIENMNPSEYFAKTKKRRDLAAASIKAFQDAKNQKNMITKTANITPKQATAITAKTPITGGISFGGEATKKTYLPFAVVAVIGAYFFFNKSKKRRR